MLSLLISVRNLLPPVDIALTVGIPLFLLSWFWPRSLVTLPATGARRRVLVAAGTAGALAVAAAATISTALSYRASPVDLTGFAGWWQRPAPLVAATLVVALSAIALRSVPLPAPGERALRARQSWRTHLSTPRLVVTATVTAMLALTCLWQTMIGTRAPVGADLYGQTPEPVDLPVFMTFNFGQGYVAGVGWPNQLPTLLAVALAAVTVILVLRTDAERPVAHASTTSESTAERTDRACTARLLLIVLAGGGLVTLGAVWGHAGDVGDIVVGFGAHANGAPQTFVSTGYSSLAFPLILAGYLLQGAGVALLLRTVTDTLRAVRGGRRRGVGNVDSSAVALRGGSQRTW